MTRTAWIHYHLFLLLIVAANVAIDLFGAASIGALIIPWGTFFAGATFVLRDLLHQTAGPAAAVSAIAIGALISYGLSNPELAIASGVAFLIAEFVDLAVFARTVNRHGMSAAVLLSGIAGAFTDTFIFLPWSGIPMSAGLIVGQLIIKSLLSAVAAVVLMRSRRPALA